MMAEKVSILFAFVLTSVLLVGCGDKKEDQVKLNSVPQQSQQSSASTALYEGKIIMQETNSTVRDKVELGYFYVKNGKKKWISNLEWVKSNGMSIEGAIAVKKDIFDSIPTENGNY